MSAYKNGRAGKLTRVTFTAHSTEESPSLGSTKELVLQLSIPQIKLKWCYRFCSIANTCLMCSCVETWNCSASQPFFFSQPLFFQCHFFLPPRDSGIMKRTVGVFLQFNYEQRNTFFPRHNEKRPTIWIFISFLAKIRHTAGLHWDAIRSNIVQ